jgi:hypothetical protein
VINKNTNYKINGGIMRESIGKQLMRNWFYLNLVPNWIINKPINDAKFLVLLGEDGYELPLLKLLGVKSENIWSIENNQIVYDKQKMKDWPVSLYFGDANEYLNYLLPKGSEFDVLNLDIEGNYSINLDPGMTTVFSFLGKSNNTILCTYNTMGRDQQMILEGLASLYVFLWLLPELTVQIFASLVATYKSFGCMEAELVVLRDFFIARSYIEHSIRSGYIHKKIDRATTKILIDEPAWLWTKVKESFNNPTNILDIARILRSIRTDKRLFFENRYNLVTVNQWSRYVYRAKRPWSQLCYFSNHVTNTYSYKEMAESLLSKMGQTAIHFTDRDGHTKTEEIHDSRETNLEKSKLITNEKQSFIPRKLVI